MEERYGIIGIEKREYYLETEIDWLEQKVEWEHLHAIVAVRSTVIKNDDMHVETRYFITALTDVRRFANSVRNHWSIENQFHWHLDVTFGEDDSKTHKDQAPLNWNVMRKTALPLIPNSNLGKK